MTTITALTEGDVEQFISKLKQSDNDKKVDLIQAFGLQLEETSDLPTTTLDALTLTVSPLLKSTSHLLISAVLTSFVPFFVPFLPASPVTHLQIALHQLLPLLLEKLNDPKERIQSAARTSVALLGKKAYEAEPASVLGGSTVKGKEKEGPVGYWERNVKEAMAGKGWRGKVECMRMLLVMRGEEKSRLSLKPWLAPLVDLLEDGDGNVRDQARETVVALLSPSGTPPAAKQEMKKLLLAKGVRKTIADGILARILGSGAAPPAAEVPILADEAPAATGTRSGAATPAMDDVDVVLVASGRDLESELASMVPHFEGKETEHNWAPREKSMVRIRGLLRGQAYLKHPESFIAGLKGGIAEGLSKTLLSLRTTVAQQACALVQELPEHMGSGFDFFVEGLLPVLGKMAGFTKKIIAERSQRSLVAIITHTTCPPRMFIAHISAGINDKNVQTRTYSTSHLKLFLDVHGSRSKHAIDSTPALLDTIEAGLKKSLADTNPAVRELARAAYWSFNSVWPSRALPIADSLDATARKQLDKADPKGTNGAATASVPTRPAAVKRPGASSSTAALLAQARKAKAAELAAGRAAQEGQRTVSSPIISSPTVQQRARATSSQVPHPVKTPLNRSQTSPQGSPTPLGSASPAPSHGSPAPRNIPRPQHSSPQDLLSRSRSSSLVRTHSRSPPSSRGSPTISKSPLRQSDVPSGLHSPGESSSSTSGRLSVRTPNPPRTSLSSGSATQGLGVFNAGTPPSANLIDLSSAPARRGTGTAEIDPALRAQADEAEKAAAQLLDLAIDDGDAPVHAPITPARTAVNGKPNGQNGSNGVHGASSLFKTPVNHFLASTPSRAPWDDSPRPEAMTPQLFAQLKERKHERSWWLKRQELMDKATPLKAPTPDPTSAVLPDVEALEHGLPLLRNLQKLALFAEEQGDGPDGARAWKEGRSFDRVFEGLMGFLQPSKPIDLLEQGLVVLWEMVRNQWTLFEDREDALVDTLFRLRATPNIVIHESINSLMSFLVEVSEPVFFFSELRSSLGRYLASHPDSEPPQGAVYVGTKAREAGYIFGLTALGMCIMRIPPQVVQIEAPRLASVISEAYGQREPQCRQAANLLVMAIQSVILDTQITIGMLDLTDAQKNLVFYLFAKNGLMGETPSGGKNGDADAVDGREKVMGEMDNLLGKAKSAVDV